MDRSLYQCTCIRLSRTKLPFEGWLAGCWPRVSHHGLRLYDLDALNTGYDVNHVYRPVSLLSDRKKLAERLRVKSWADFDQSYWHVHLEYDRICRNELLDEVLLGLGELRECLEVPFGY